MQQSSSSALILGVFAALLLVMMTPLLIVMATTEEEEETLTANCEPSGDSKAPEAYQQFFTEAAAISGLPEDIVVAQTDQESNMNPDAVSHAGAQGISQIMPATWEAYGEGGDPFDPKDAIAAQGRVMKAMMTEVEDLAGDDETEQIKLALAAYNAGPGNVQQHNGIPPFAETQNYVEVIMDAADSDSLSVNCATFASGRTDVEGVGEDDYPYREPVGEKGWDFPKTEFGHTQRECTDFVAWRMNQAMGWSPDSDEPPPFSFSALGVSYGSGQTGAGSWMDILTQVDGISSTDDPQAGDIAWWGYNDIGGGYGHVGFVAEVNGDDIVVENYNLNHVSAYSVSTYSVDEIPGFIQVSQ